MRLCSFVLTGAAMLVAATPSSVSGQVVQEHVTGLRAPTRLVALPDGSLLVAEAGAGSNTGRVSLVDRDARVATIVDGLPSGLYGPSREPSGPSGLLLLGRRLFILIGGGGAALQGANGVELVNPDKASPLLSSVLLLEFDQGAEVLPLGFVLAPDRHASIAAGGGVYLVNADGVRARLSRLVDFPDTTPEPRPDEPANVRASNPFGLVGSDAHLDVVDASRNLLWRVRTGNPHAEPFVRFPPVPNTSPIGPPVVDAVPATVRADGDSLLVSYLTGFPFGAGAARVVRVNRSTGETTVVASGLQTAIDVLPLGDGRRLLVLEYSTNFLAGAPGRLLLIDDPTRTPLVLADTLAQPTSIAIDPRSGDVFVSEINAGRIVRVLVP
jgi:hypothetical protein